MTLTVTSAPSVHRPLPVRILTILLVVLGIGAVGGGFAMVFGIGGESILPDEYLDALPLVDNWVIPGLILMIGFGFGSLTVAFGVWRRPTWAWLDGVERLTGRHWSWIATILIGVGQMIWITLELVSIPFSAFMPTFGAVGLALALLPLASPVKDYLKSA